MVNHVKYHHKTNYKNSVLYLKITHEIHVIKRIKMNNLSFSKTKPFKLTSLTTTSPIRSRRTHIRMFSSDTSRTKKFVKILTR